MRGREFFDTNIILYAKIDDSSQKHIIAKNLLENRILHGSPCISIQVVNEFAVNALRKGRKLSDVETIVEQLFEVFDIANLNKKSVTDALSISSRYQFSFWDSLIVAAALEERCSVLYTEDLQSGQIVDNVLEIKNPFKVS